MESAVGHGLKPLGPSSKQLAGLESACPQGVVPTTQRREVQTHDGGADTRLTAFSSSSLKQASTDVSCSHCRPSCPDPQSCEYLPT